MIKTNFTIQFFDSEGRDPILRFLRRFDRATIGHISRGIALLEEHGKGTGMPDVKKISGQLYELRIRGKNELRLLFTQQGDTVYILHIYKKQTQKLPRKELKLALKRLTII